MLKIKNVIFKYKLYSIVLLHHHNCMHSHSHSGRAEDSCGAGVPVFVVAHAMLQVVETDGLLISTLPQSLFLFNGLELNNHDIAGRI